MPPLPEHWGWFYPTPEIAADLARQLAFELGRGHLLDGKAVEVVGHRLGTDDILCRHVSEPSRFTVVHLSFSTIATKDDADPDHPTVESDGTFDDFLAYEAKWYKPKS